MMVLNFLTSRLQAGLVAALLVLLAGGAFADEMDCKETAAVTAALSFISLVDQGEYTKSWEQASRLFAERIPKETWIDGISRLRPVFGAVQERTLKGSHCARSLPGAPDGEYVLLLFTTQFEKNVTAVETITMVLDLDGRWRSAGYFVE